LSQQGEGHKIYPYLLKGVEVTRVNQVWSTDITYVGWLEGLCTWWRSWTGSAGSC